MDDEVHRTPGGRSEDTSPDPEMAEGGSIGRRPVVRDETGYAAGSSGKVRLGITSGQDTTDRVRAVRRSGPEAAGRGKTRDLHLPGLYHYCGRRHKSGTFTVWRITAKKRMVAKLKAIKVELQRRMHDRIAEVGAWLRKVVLGYYQYHAVPGNTMQLRIF